MIFLVQGCSGALWNSRTGYEIGPFPEDIRKTSYSEVYEKVIGPKCVQCHGNSGGVNLETPRNVKANLERIRRTAIIQRSMPKLPVAPLTPEEYELLSSWISSGGPTESEPPAMPTPVPLVPTFESIRDRIFVSKCLTCHGPGGEAARISLSSPQDMIDSPLEVVIPGNPEESGLVLVLQPDARKLMPPSSSGISPVSSEELQIIKTWIYNGAKD